MRIMVWSYQKESGRFSGEEQSLTCLICAAETEMREAFAGGATHEGNETPGLTQTPVTPDAPFEEEQKQAGCREHGLNRHRG